MPTAARSVSESKKGEIKGKADAISKYLGSADLGGQIEMQRKTIYQTSDASEAARLDRYLFYVACMVIMKDKNANFQAKIDAIKELRKPLSSQCPKSEIQRKFLEHLDAERYFFEQSEAIHNKHLFAKRFTAGLLSRVHSIRL